MIYGYQIIHGYKYIYLILTDAKSNYTVYSMSLFTTVIKTTEYKLD